MTADSGGPGGVAELRRRAALARSELQRLQGERQALERQRQYKAAELETVRVQAQVLDQAAVLLRETSEHAREQARQQIERLVTHSLKFVFGPDFGFRIELKEGAGRPQAEFYVTSAYADGVLETRPEESRGGGVVDVVSLGLRLAMLETYRPPLAGALVLDEPAKHVSDDFIQPVAQFLLEASQFFARQVIMVTHNQHLAELAERAWRVQLRDGRSQVTPLARGGGESA